MPCPQRLTTATPRATNGPTTRMAALTCWTREARGGMGSAARWATATSRVVIGTVLLSGPPTRRFEVRREHLATWAPTASRHPSTRVPAHVGGHPPESGPGRGPAGRHPPRLRAVAVELPAHGRAACVANPGRRAGDLRPAGPVVLRARAPGPGGDAGRSRYGAGHHDRALVSAAASNWDSRPATQSASSTWSSPTRSACHGSGCWPRRRSGP